MEGRKRYVRPTMLLVTGPQNDLGIAIALAIFWLWVVDGDKSTVA